MEISKELYHKIAVICDSVNIAVIGDNIFVYHSFTPSSSGNTSSIDFNTIVGVNVTEFFTMNQIEAVGPNTAFNARFVKYFDPLPILNIKFNKTMEYLLFSK
jgi:hypothetical protein